MNRRIIICDIDGVVCDSSARIAKYSDFEALERGDYNAFRVSMHAYNSAPVDEDVPLHDGIQILRGLRHSYASPEHGPALVKFLTSRGNESRSNTFEWLRAHVDENLEHENLIMRPEYFESEPGIFGARVSPVSVTSSTSEVRLIVFVNLEKLLWRLMTTYLYARCTSRLGFLLCI